MNYALYCIHKHTGSNCVLLTPSYDLCIKEARSHFASELRCNFLDIDFFETSDDDVIDYFLNHQELLKKISVDDYNSYEVEFNHGYYVKYKIEVTT